MKYIGRIAAGLLLAAWIAPASAQTLTSPAVTVTALSTASAQIIGTNPTRKAITICNPSTIIEWIMPGPGPAVASSGIGLPAVSTGTTTCITFTAPQSVPGSTSAVGNSWYALSASSTPNITVIEQF